MQRVQHCLAWAQINLDSGVSEALAGKKLGMKENRSEERGRGTSNTAAEPSNILSLRSSFCGLDVARLVVGEL